MQRPGLAIGVALIGLLGVLLSPWSGEWAKKFIGIAADSGRSGTRTDSRGDQPEKPLKKAGSRSSFDHPIENATGKESVHATKHLQQETSCATEGNNLVRARIDASMIDGNLFVDDQPCRSQIADVNVSVSLAKGSHVLSIRKGEKECRATVTVPQLKEEVLPVSCE